LISLRGVAVFADYQLLAAMGQLLAYMKMDRPIEAEPIDIRPANLFVMKAAPIRWRLDEPGSEPLNAANPPNAREVTGWWPATWGYRAGAGPYGNAPVVSSQALTTTLFSSAFETGSAAK